jgi:uncharacterized membrane protein YbhN (UPF0104 family)
MKPRARTVRWFGVLFSIVSVLLIVALFARSDPHQLLEALSRAQFSWLLAAIGLVFTIEVGKAWRWQLLLGVERTAFGMLLSLLFHARLLNALAPFRAGEVWRVAATSAGSTGAVPRSVGSIVVEKGLDAAALGVIGVATVGAVRTPCCGEMSALGGSALALGVLGALMGLAWFGVGRTRGLSASSVGRRFTQLWVLARRAAPERGTLLAVILFTVAAHGLGLFANLAVLRALEIQGGLAAAAIMLLSGYAAGLLPSGPGQIGVFELAVATPLAAAGMPPVDAFAAALLLHATLLWTFALGALTTAGWTLARHPGARPGPMRHGLDADVSG